MQELISVIVPVYNVEKYLHECVDSILRQTYSCLEIILIDDGSTDQSGKICDDYSRADDRVIVLHQKNSGVSKARNIGIAIAKGKYLTFVDSDDIIGSQFVFTLVQNIQKYNVQLVVTGHTRNISTLNTDNNYNIKIISAQHIYDQMLTHGNFDGYLWGKLFCKGVIDEYHIKCPNDIMIWEDMYFVLQYLQHIESVAFCGSILYFYRENEQSITNSISLKKIQSLLKVSKMFMELEKNSKSLYYAAAKKLYFEELVGYNLYIIKHRNVSKDHLIAHIKYMNIEKKGTKIKRKTQMKCSIIKMFRFFYKQKDYFINKEGEKL